jgi:hypothetical protein
MVPEQGKPISFIRIPRRGVWISFSLKAPAAKSQGLIMINNPQDELIFLGCFGVVAFIIFVAFLTVVVIKAM